MSRTNGNQQMSLRQAGKVIKKLRIQDNTVLLIKEGTAFATEGALNALRAELNRSTTAKGVVIAVVADLDDIAALPEIEMRKHGWYKLRTVRQLLLRDKEKAETEDIEEEPVDEED